MLFPVSEAENHRLGEASIGFLTGVFVSTVFGGTKFQFFVISGSSINGLNCS